MSIQFYYSETISALKTIFIETLTQSYGNDPFKTSQIIVPNINVKKWLQLEIAKKNGISTHLKLSYLETSLISLINTVAPITKEEQQRYVFLGDKDRQIDLQLMILSIIENEHYDPDLESIYKYLHITKGENGKIIRKSDGKDYIKRSWQLAEKLSFYFREYEYQRIEMIQKWAENSLFLEDATKKNRRTIEICQRKIYKKIFDCTKTEKCLSQKYSNNKTIYTTLPRYADQLLGSPQKDKSCNNNSKETVFIFGLSQISDFHFSLITRLEPYYNFKIFQQNFLESFHTHQEKGWNFIGKEIEKQEDNSLIKKWAKPFYENIKIFKKRLGNDFSTIWHSPFPIYPKKNLLNQLKNSLLHYDFDKNQIPQDCSLQIFGAPSIRREIESVWNSVIHNMEEDKGLKLTDIAVLVPDMDLYKPHIKSIFDSNELIRYNLTDTTASTESLFANAVISGLEIATGSYTRPEISNFILNPCFMTKAKIDQETVNQWLRWIDSLNIFYSYDMKDKAQYSNETNHRFTWGGALKRLRLGRIMGNSNSVEENVSGFLPYWGQTNVDTLNQFISIMEQLFRFYQKMKDKKYTGKEWKELISCFINDFLTIPEEIKEENSVSIELFSILDKLERFDRLLDDRKLDMTYILSFIKTHLTEIPVSRGRYLSDGVTISKLSPMKPIPFQIIYIVGLGEELFPGKPDKSTLDLRNAKPQQGDIDKSETDTYLFLELLMATESKLYLSYISSNISKDQKLYPSPILKNLIAYLNENLLPSDKYFEIFQLPLKWESLKNVQGDHKASRLTDLFSCYNDMQRLMAYLYHEEQITEEQNKRLVSEQYNTYIERWKNIPTVQRHAMDSDSEKKVTLFQLYQYLLNPAEAKINRILKTGRKKETTNANMLECEPFYEKEYYIENKQQEILFQFIIKKHQNREYHQERLRVELLNQYQFEQLSGAMPEGIYGKLSERKLMCAFDSLFYSENNFTQSLETLSQELLEYQYCEKIEFLNGKPEFLKRYLSPSFTINVKEDPAFVFGAAKNLFIDPKNKRLLFLLVCKEKEPAYEKFLENYLFYCLFLFAEKEYKLFQWQISLEAQKIDKYEIQISPETSKNYLQNLINSYYQDQSYDIIPLKFLLQKKQKFLSEEANKKESEVYYQEFMKSFREGIEKDYNLIKLSEWVILSKADVPKDIQNKVFERYSILNHFSLKTE